MFGKEKQIIHVEGMHCEHCASRVEKALCSIEGVKSAKVNLEKKEAVVIAKGGVSEQDAKKAIEGIGFVYAGMEK